MLRRLFERSRAIILRYQTEAECYWRMYKPALDVAKVHIIPNGFDGEIDEFVEPGGNRFTILYTGTMSSYRYDTLLQALDAFKKFDRDRAKRLRLLFVGDGMQTLANDAGRLGLSDIITIVGPTPHAEIIRLQKEAHALLMLERTPTIKGYELLAGAKLFGYLRAGRPIIGVLPSGEAKKILQRIGVPTIADVDTPTEIISVLRQLLETWEAGKLALFVPDRGACEAYSAQRQTAALTRALEGAQPSEPFVPGRVEIPPSLRSAIGER
jgi:glycosyltransferase involved in cell wall biosynthesis